MCSNNEAPQPDPLIGQAAKMSAELGEKALKWYQDIYNTDTKPRQDAADALTAKLVDQQMRIADNTDKQGTDYYNYLKEVYRPLEKDIVAEANAFDTNAERERIATQAGADITHSFNLQRGQMERGLRSFGIQPSEASAHASLPMDVAEAAAKAGAMTRARFQARDIGYARKMDAAGLGRGLPGNSSTAYGISLNAGNSAGQNSLANDANARAGQAQAGGGYTQAMQGWGQAGQTALGGYNAAMRGYEADTALKGAMWQGIGSAAGTAVGMKWAKGAADGGEVVHRGLRVNYASGGEVDGPGTGVSDSIPMEGPEGETYYLSDGEFIIPADVVKKKGTEFFEKLLEKYHTPAAVQRQQGIPAR